MCIRSRKNLRCAEQGISLIELLVFIVVIGIALAGIILAMNLDTDRSVTERIVNPVLRKQALAVAEALLEEVESLPFASIDSYPSSPTNAHIPPGYSASVAVVQDSSFGVDASPLTVTDVRRITVTVTYNAGHDSISLAGYRTNY